MLSLKVRGPIMDAESLLDKRRFEAAPVLDQHNRC